MEGNFDALLTSVDSEERTEEHLQPSRGEDTIAVTPDTEVGEAAGRTVPKKERVRCGAVNVPAAITALTVATAVTVGIPVLAAALILKAVKKEK